MLHPVYLPFDSETFKHTSLKSEESPVIANQLAVVLKLILVDVQLY